MLIGSPSWVFLNVVFAKNYKGSLRFCNDLRKFNNKPSKTHIIFQELKRPLTSLLGREYFTNFDLG